MNLTWLYIAALYFGATELARRRGADLPRSITAIFYVLVLLFLFRPMTGAYTNVATDVLQLLPPWSADAPEGRSKYNVANLQQSDVPMQLAPWAHQVRESWRSGRVPVWNDLTGAGFPLISNGQGGALSPIRILALPLSFAHSLTAEAAMKMLIALTFMFLFARRLGLSTIASLIAAIAYGIGPFLLVWMHFAQSTVAAFLPVVMYVIDRLAEQRTYGRVVAAALVVPAVLFSGHPDTASQMALFAAAYAWVGRKNIVAIALAGVIGTLLALPFIVPFLEALPHGFRYATVEEAPRVAVPYSDFPSLLLLAMPRFFGDLPDEAIDPAHAESITGFAGVLGIAGFFSLLLNKPRSRELFFVVAAIALFLVLANIPLVVRALHLVLPLGSHARMRFLFAFTMAIAAAFFIDKPRKLPAIVLTLTLLAAISLGMRTLPPLKGLAPSLIVLAGAAAFSVWRRRLGGAALAALIAAELTLLTIHWNPLFPEQTLYARTPLIEAVQRHHERNKDRVTAIDGPLFPNTNLPFAIEDMRVLDAMAPARYMRLLNLVSPRYDLTKYFVTWHDADTPFLDYLNVRWLMTDAKTELAAHRYRKVYEGKDGRLYENKTVLPRFFAARNLIVEGERSTFLEKLRASDWRSTAYVQSMRGLTEQQRNDLLAPRPKNAPEASMRITKSTQTRYEMRINAPRHTLVVSSVGWWHWWRVEIAAGKKLQPYRVNEAFLGFVAPPGEHNIIVQLVPVSLYVATGVAATTLMALLIGFVATGGRTMRNVTALLVVGVALSAQPASAMCIATAPELLEIRIDRCRTAPVYVRDISSCLPAATWARRSMVEIGARTKGVVIEATILRSAKTTSAGVPTEPMTARATEDRAQLLFSNANASCEALLGNTIQVLKRARCCDVSPPYDFQCYFGLDAVEDLAVTK